MTTTAENAVATEKTAPEKTVDKVSDKRRALGRGLESLLPAGPRVVAGAAVPAARPVPPADGTHGAVLPEVQAQAARAAAGDAVAQIALDQIDSNPYQTRHAIGKEALAELAESIRVNGVVQPIVVRPAPDGRYVLVLGERRCRASKLAGKTTVPAIVRTVSDQQAAEMTIVENLQRQDLNCLEQANGFARLSRDFGLTQDQIGQRTGISRESVSNYMRLLKLPPMVQHYLSEGSLGFSEARVLLQLSDPDSIHRIADEAVLKHLSVAQLKDLVDRTNAAILEPKKNGQARWQDPNVHAAQTELERLLGVRVRIADRKGKGKIVIEYASLEDFDRVVEMLKGKS
jgi:ParB family transcriptional regulator, chromosome partitioning protein